MSTYHLTLEHTEMVKNVLAGVGRHLNFVLGVESGPINNFSLPDIERDEEGKLVVRYILSMKAGHQSFKRIPVDSIKLFPSGHVSLDWTEYSFI